jgi:formimidoylglutamate deiminase
LPRAQCWLKAGDNRSYLGQSGRFYRGYYADSDAGEAIRLDGEVIPAIANLHSHAFQRAMAGLAEVAGDPQDSFWTWRDLMYRMVQRLTPEQVGDIAALLYIEMLKGGYSQGGGIFTICIDDPDGMALPRRRDACRQLIRAARSGGYWAGLCCRCSTATAGLVRSRRTTGRKRFIQQTDRYLPQHSPPGISCNASGRLLYAGLLFSFAARGEM